jgi:hypothetical protein
MKIYLVLSFNMALSARTNNGRCPRLIGSLAVTVPSTYWLLQQGPGKSHGHSSHGEHHEKEEHENAETKGKSEDTSESESDDSSDESKQDTPDTSDDETEAVNASGGGDADESTEGGEAKDKGTVSYSIPFVSRSRIIPLPAPLGWWGQVLPSLIDVILLSLYHCSRGFTGLNTVACKFSNRHSRTLKN